MFILAKMPLILLANDSQAPQFLRRRLNPDYKGAQSPQRMNMVGLQLRGQVCGPDMLTR